MSLGEFELIERFFSKQSVRHQETLLGVGDDGAVLSCPPGWELVVSADTLVSGVHFLPDTDPYKLGYKALAVNLSDLAAMGAEPKWVILALTLPSVEASWLEQFSRGFLTLARDYATELVGGDTTRGPLTISVQAMGLVPAGAALRRSGARPGDLVYVSGVLGSAGLALKFLLGQSGVYDARALTCLETPVPRIELGRQLRGIARSCIDVSDGLAGDLGHVLKASCVGATLDYERLPCSDSVRRYIAESGDWTLPLVAGDDYELCFTVSPEAVPELEDRLAACGTPATVIGLIESGSRLVLRRCGSAIELPASGYTHFR